MTRYTPTARSNTNSSLSRLRGTAQEANVQMVLRSSNVSTGDNSHRLSNYVTNLLHGAEPFFTN
jgi:hypothetical protein